MESGIKMQIQKRKKLRILFETWHMLQHSYGIVSAFILIHFYKKYSNKVEIYVKEVPYYIENWNNTKKLVYSEEYNEILKNLKQWNGEEIDIIYRQTFPYNILVHNENINIPKCVFYTSEFGVLEPNYFLVATPENTEKTDEYIKVYLKQFKNIYFTNPSSWSAQGMKKYLEEPEKRDRIITHGVDSSIFYRNKKNRQIIRNKYNIKDTDILMINIGSMTGNKGIVLILEAMHYLINIFKKTHFKLLLKGSSDLYNSRLFIEKYFEEIKKTNIMNEHEINNLLENYIIFTENTLSFNVINDLYNAADLYISPYLCEGFGLTMLEALSSGLNVLVPSTGSSSDYIDNIYDNGNGKDFIIKLESKVIKLEDGKMQNNMFISDLINILIENETNLKKEKDNSLMFEFIKENYSWYKVSDLLFDYFNYIV